MSNITKNNWTYKFMRSFADSHNDLHDYTLLHYATWFTCRALLLMVMAIAVYCDFSVIYGMFYNVNKDDTASFWIGAGGATVIALLILSNGTMFIKLSINSKHGIKLKKRRALLEAAGKKTASLLLRENAIQWYIHGSLMVIGLVMTGFLSFHSDQKTKAEAYKYDRQLANEMNQDISLIEKQHQAEINRLNTKYSKDSSTMSKQYDDLIAAAAPEHKKSIAGYESRHKQQLITKEKYLGAVNYLNVLIENAEKGPKDEKASALLELSKKHLIQLEKLQESHYITKSAATVKPEKKKDREYNLEVAAITTKGLNLLLNLVSVLLTAGLLFFSRGANVGREVEPDEPLSYLEKKTPDYVLVDDVEDNENGKQEENEENDEDLEEYTEENAESEAVDESVPSVNNNEDNSQDSDKHYIPVIDHQGKLYNRAQGVTFMRTYRERAAKYLNEDKLDLVPHNLKMAEYWQSKVEELDK